MPNVNTVDLSESLTRFKIEANFRRRSGAAAYESTLSGTDASNYGNKLSSLGNTGVFRALNLAVTLGSREDRC